MEMKATILQCIARRIIEGAAWWTFCLRVPDHYSSQVPGSKSTRDNYEALCLWWNNTPQALDN